MNTEKDIFIGNVWIIQKSCWGLLREFKQWVSGVHSLIRFSHLHCPDYKPRNDVDSGVAVDAKAISLHDF